MKYAGFKENIKLSKLGLGAMRLPQTEPGLAKPVDEPKPGSSLTIVWPMG